MEQAKVPGKLVELENVITEFQNQLFRFAFFRTGSYAEAQDIVQDVFIKLYYETSNLQFVTNLKSYLYKSISNACMDYRRKTIKLKFQPIEKTVFPAEMHQSQSSEEWIQKEEFKRLENLLDELPEEQADTIRMRVFDELSFVEIAEVLEIPVTTIKSRFKYGIDKLKSKIAKCKEVNYGM